MHDTPKMTDLTKSQWGKQNMATLVDQLRHRGVTITPEQLKGGKDENGEKIEKLKRPELAEMLIKIDFTTK